jgi:MoaA/NifB/PqqE/SkfB family radical SAM enzyme
LELIRRGAIFKVNVSLDGASADSHDKYRLKAGSFERVLGALPALREAGLPQLNLSVAVYDDNLHELGDICELARRHGATSVSFKPVTMSARADRKERNGRLPMAGAGWSLSEQGLARYRRLREELRDTYQTDEMRVEGAINSAEVPEAENDAMNCHGAEEALFIASNGDLTPCELVTEYLSVPNVRTTAAASAWLASRAFDEFRTANAERRAADARSMSGCPAMLFARQARSSSPGCGGADARRAG